MKRYIALLLVALMAFSMISAMGVVSAKKLDKPLAKPHLLTPKNNEVIGNTPDYIRFEWTPVDGATSYMMVIQAYWQGEWVEAFTYEMTTPYQDLQAAGDSGIRFRWHVIAISSDPTLNSAPSSWHFFTMAPMA